MTNRYELYRCNICGNLIEVLISGDGHPVCCGEEMERVEIKNDSKNSAMLTEKHSPVSEMVDGSNIVSVPKHPMGKEHYIMFIQTISDDRSEVKTKFFSPDEAAEMTDCIGGGISARSYCNIHGLYTME